MTRETRVDSIVEEEYQLTELKFYLVEFELHNIMWFSSITHPHIDAFVQTQIPIIHNYPLLLALIGDMVEESYVARYNLYKCVDPPASRFRESGLYTYPMEIHRAFYKKLLLSMAETDYILYKPRTRLAVPIMTHYNVLAPGTRGRTVVIARRDVILPQNELYIRLGAKRTGVWRAIKIQEAQAKIINKYFNLHSLFNISDVKSSDLLGNLAIVLKHYAGDISLSGSVSRYLEIRAGREVVFKPVPFFISS